MARGSGAEAFGAAATVPGEADTVQSPRYQVLNRPLAMAIAVSVSASKSRHLFGRLSFVVPSGTVVGQFESAQSSKDEPSAVRRHPVKIQLQRAPLPF